MLFDKHQLKNVFHKSKIESDVLMSYSGTNLEYIGFAAPGSLPGDKVWSIRKLVYDVSDNLLSVRYADGVATFNKEWDERTSYTYI
jgi:hypothetical protein